MRYLYITAALSVFSHAALAQGQMAMLDTLKPGVYGVDQAACALDRENIGDVWGAYFKYISIPEFSVGYETSCTVRNASDANGVLEIDAACNAEGEIQLGHYAWKITSATSFTDITARNGPQEYTLCDQASGQADAALAWTSAIVHTGTTQSPRVCDDNRTESCLRSNFEFSDETIDFIMGHWANENAPTGIPIEFREVSQVDIVRSNTASASGLYTLFVNGVPPIQPPVYTPSAIGMLPPDLVSRELAARYQGSSAWYQGVHGHRILPTGYSRFATVSYFTDFCRACPVIGQAIAYNDFNLAGKRIAYQYVGMLDARDLPINFEPTVQQLRARLDLVQFALNIRGYDAGPMDGNFGPRSRAALSEFQNENHINHGSGQLDEQTLQALADNSTLFDNGGANAVSNAVPTVGPATFRLPHEAPEGYLWVQIASRATLEEAVLSAREFNLLAPGEIRAFTTNSGWYAITGGIWPEFTLSAEEVERFILERGYPDDYMFTKGETYVEEIDFQESEGSVEAAFTSSQTLRNTWLLSRYTRDNKFIYDRIERLSAGSELNVWGVYGEDCLVDGHEGVFVKCVDIVGFADIAGIGLTIENSGPDLFNIFWYMQAEHCAEAQCIYIERSVRYCEPLCEYEGVEDTYVAERISLEEVRRLLPKSTGQMKFYVQQGIPTGVREDLDQSLIAGMEAHRVFRKGCEGENCKSFIVLVQDEFSGYVVDINSGEEQEPSTANLTYVAEDIRNWALYDSIGGDEIRQIYTNWLYAEENAIKLAETMAVMNLIKRDTSPEVILDYVNWAMEDIILSRELLTVLGGNTQVNNAEQGYLYTLWVLNRARNRYQPPSIEYDNLVSEGFEKLSAQKSAFHAINIDADRVEKWVHSDGREYVFFAQDGGRMEMLFNDLNAGTYNYCGSPACHMVMDILPWVKWGASLGDTSTPEDRAKLFQQSLLFSNYTWSDLAGFF